MLELPSEAVLLQIQNDIRSNMSLVFEYSESIRKQLSQIDGKKKEWLKWKHSFSSDTLQSSIIRLNIGGKCITLRRDLVDLHATDGNFFGLVSGQYDKLLPRDKNGRVFLDMDAKWIKPLINLARDMTMWDGVDENTRPKCCCDPLYVEDLKVVFPPSEKRGSPLFDSNILNGIYVDLSQSMSEWLGWSGQLCSTLLFRGSRDGFTANKFHELCDGHEHTVSIIRDTSGNVFGGYADIVWSRSEMYSQSSKCFLFSVQKDGITSYKKFGLKYDCNNTAIKCSSDRLCCFGNGHDLYVSNDCNLKHSSHSDLGYSYDNSARISLASKRSFKVSEIEVFKIIHSDAVTVSSLLERQCALVGSNKAAALANTISSHNPYFTFTNSIMDSAMSQLRQLEDSLEQAKKELLVEAISVRNELKYVMRFADVDQSIIPAERVSNDAENLEEVETEIESLFQLMTSQANSNDCSDSSDIVYINVADDSVLAVSKATLLQAPSGSILANMASDVWGHDLDSEGNIVQDVNPELFRLIIAHLRLKTLLQREDRMSEVPPISVYAEQKAAMVNLLAFYGMSEVTLKVLKLANECR